MSLRSLPLLVAFLIPGFLLAQETAPLSERVDVNLVLIDAVVTDSRGNQILGLEKDDFIITENGTEQVIDSVDYFTNRRLLTAPEERAAFRVERVREDRYFVFFFHKDLDLLGHSLYTVLNRARQGAVEFVEKRMLPGDKIAVAGFDARLKIFSDFTDDKRTLIRAFEDAVQFGNGLTASNVADASPSIFDALEVREMTHGTGRIYDAVSLLSDAVRPIRARKVMFLFSAGIGYPDPTNPNFRENELRFEDPMMLALNRANVTVYSMNLRSNTRFSPTEEVLSRMAVETGGDYYRSVVNFSTPLRLAERKNTGYYLLSYYVPRRASPSDFQRVVVKLRNPEFRVSARAGYAPQ